MYSSRSLQPHSFVTTQHAFESAVHFDGQHKPLCSDLQLCTHPTNVAPVSTQPHPSRTQHEVEPSEHDLPHSFVVAYSAKATVKTYDNTKDQPKYRIFADN
mmetsp:Transcript_6497/g.10291  ORF Transcript_6497/g.10291 Transcript_6497/m.10291 type:complete len:101 (+) Transcript_6497:368-670(+)